MTATYPDRCEYLSELSGLNVEVRQDRGRNVYVFLRGSVDVIGFMTYQKAKAYALGRWNGLWG